MINDLMDDFVCLRMIQMNGVELAQFQFDYDMSFAVFFMNPDGTIYGRYGTRDSRPPEADKDISMEGLREAMVGALALHKGYPANADSLKAKKGLPPKYPSAELFPQMKTYTPTINYENEVAKSCIHCHQIHNAERQILRDAKEIIPDETLYLYPMPQVVGLELDTTRRATVIKVEPASPAAEAGVKAGDEILFAKGQPLISVADFQWVLNGTPGIGADIPLKVRRGNTVVELALKLEDGWRRKTDFSWRVSTWDLRRMVLGGMSLEVDDSPQKTELGIYVKAAGKFGDHAVARRAGVLPDDKLVSIAGIREGGTEAEIIAGILNSTKKGDPVEMTVKRGGKELKITYRTQ